ncbi:MAG: VWA domain-containing protein [Deltaproteobacteria bacterium]|nr:VWA domain-containing protein [Deltaproteobacteria bacterium]
MTLRAHQFTNIGNGLACARKMLLNDRRGNPKYIILITDGSPNAALSGDDSGTAYHSRVAAFSRETTMETKRAMGTHHAIVEAGKTSRKNIKISVVYISPEGEDDEASERTAREIARIGCGKFQKVTSIEQLPLDALATAG